MKRLLVFILFAVLLPAVVFAGMPPPPPLIVEEADGSPSGAVVKFVFTNASVTSITNGVATIDVGAGAGSPMTLDLGNDGVVIESVDLAKIATTGDTNSIFTESAPDVLLIDVSKRWPTADVANAGDSATAFFSAGTIEAARLPVTSAATAGLVPTTNGVTNGWVLEKQADGSAAWAASASGVTTLAALTDAGIAAPADGHVLIWDTDSWDNKAVSGDVTIAKTGAVTIGDDKILERHLKAVDAASDEDVLTYESTTGDFEWHSRNEIVSGATVVAPADGVLWNLEGITHSGAATEGFVLPNWANVVPGADKKFLAADGSNLKLYNGGWVTIGATAAPTDATYLTLSNDATLSAERVLTEGLAIDFTDAGANGALTIAFDPTELTGDRTWAAGGAASITWTFNNSGAVDPSFTAGDGLFTFNQAVTVTGTLTANGGIVMGTGDGFTVNGVNLLSGDELDGTKIRDADYGDVTVSAAGAWAVEDDSHAHTSTTITLASTNLSDTTNIARLDASNTFTGTTNTVGNANTDILAVQATLRGVGRAVSIDDDTTTAPTYATGVGELFVAGDIESGGTIYAQAFILSGTGDSYIDLTSNAAYPEAAGNNSIAVVANAWKIKENGTEKDLITADNSVTWTGATQSFSGVTNMVLPNTSADAAGEISINQTTHQLMLHAGGASADNALQTFDFDSCGSGQVMKSNGSGAWTCADDATAGSPTLNSVGNPTGDTTIAMDAGEEVNFDYTGNFTTGSQFRVRQVTGNPSGGVLFEVLGTDTDITLVKMGDGTNGVTLSSAGALTAAGTGTIVATGLTAGTAPVPATAGGVALGSATAEWDHLYLHDAAVIYGQADQSNTLTSAATGWTANLLFTGNAGLSVGNGATGPGFIRLKEDSDNGTDYSTITGAADAGTYPSFTFSGSQGSEDLTLAVTAANTWTVSSSTGVTDISFSAINMATTGTIQGATKINADSNGMSQGEMTTAGMYGTFYTATGAGTWNLPAAAAGMCFCIYSTTAAAIVINPDNSDVITLNGTALSAGDSITSASGAGDFICLLAVSDSSWLTLGRSGTWTDTN
jgi:hypothetical protein